MSLQVDKEYNDKTFAGTVSFTTPPNLPDDTVDNDAIKLDPNNLVDADKLEQRRAVYLATAIGTDVASVDEIVHIFDADATIEDVSIVCETAPAGGDKKVQVDVKTYTGSWASILSAAEDVDTTYADNTRQSVTLSGTPTVVAGNLLRITLTASGSTGTQAQGLTVVIKYTEDP